MDKLDLPVMGERTWFNKLVQSLNTLDGRINEEGFNRNYVLMNGLSRPNQDGDLGIDRFKVGSINVVYGWGRINVDLKQYQSGVIKLPYPDASYRCVVSDIYTWDGDMKFDSVDNGQIVITPNTDVKGTWGVHFIMIWPDN